MVARQSGPPRKPATKFAHLRKKQQQARSTRETSARPVIPKRKGK